MKQIYTGSIHYTLPDETDLVVKYALIHDPGVTMGLPESCYPPEGELTINSITENSKPYKGALSDNDMDEIEDACCEHADDQGWGQSNSDIEPPVSDE